MGAAPPPAAAAYARARSCCELRVARIPGAGSPVSCLLTPVVVGESAHTCTLPPYRAVHTQPHVTHAASSSRGAKDKLP
jgi:hypothetical protein